MQNKTDHANTRSLTKKNKQPPEKSGGTLKNNVKKNITQLCGFFRNFFCNFLLVDAYPNIQRLSHMYRMYI